MEAITESGGWVAHPGLLDVYTQQWLAVEVESTFPAQKVLDPLERLF